MFFLKKNRVLCVRANLEKPLAPSESPGSPLSDDVCHLNGQFFVEFLPPNYQWQVVLKNLFFNKNSFYLLNKC